jgi:O-antigen ligase
MVLAQIQKTFSLMSLRRFLSFFGVFCALIAALAVFSNDAYYFVQYGLTPSVLLFISAFALSLLPGAFGLAGVIALLPLTAGIPSMATALLGVEWLAMPNPGLDLVAGLFVGMLLKLALQSARGIANPSRLPACPWQIGLVLTVISVSTGLAIARNLYMSATATSIKGLLYNLIHFRPLDWRADYLPLGNWVAYAIASALIMMVIARLKQIPAEKRSAWIFRPFMLGLAIAAAIGLIQAATGLGLSESQLGFRKDIFGYAAMGMQPDLHAFAAHMLLGVVGLWGYFFTCKSRVEKLFIVAVFILCAAALVASKSRASLVIAIFALLLLGLIYFYRQSKKYFFLSLIIFALIIFFAVLGLNASEGLRIPGLGWVGELLAQAQSRRLDNLSDLGGMMGSRFEIWSAVSNMFSAYPLMGVGEGEFYRLSSNISFARSEFLQLNHGENAHNYFLQVLAENGLLGILVFAIAFIAPYRACPNKRIIFPAAIGLIGLFLGNVFAHAFLVRENLLLGAALLGLLYVFAGDRSTQNLASDYGGRISSKHRLWVGLGSFVLLVAIVQEVYNSVGRVPFKAGIDCFVKELPLYKDRWTSGAWEERLPKGASAIEFTLVPNRPQLEKNPLSARLELLSWEAGKGKVPINTITHQWSANEPATLRLELPSQYWNSANVITARLQLSSCYTPRNLGMNTDGRRLGIQIEELRYRSQ